LNDFRNFINMEGVFMRFIKGIIIGSAITAAAYMMYEEGMLNRKRMTKQARKLAHKMGINC
jgi:gas vesicle protein